MIQNACENTTDAKQTFPRRPLSAQSAKHATFCTPQGRNAPPKVLVLEPFWAWKLRLAHGVCKNRVSKMCLPSGQGAHFYEISKIRKKNHAKKHEKRQKLNKVTEIAKIKAKS